MHILNSLRQYTLRSQQNALCRNACSLLSHFYSFFMSAQACVKWQHSPAAYGYRVVYKTRNKTVITGKRHKSWLNDASHLLGSVSHLCNHYTPLHWLRVAIQGHILGTPKRNENWKPARGFNKREFFVCFKSISRNQLLYLFDNSLGLLCQWFMRKSALLSREASLPGVEVLARKILYES